MFDEWIGKADLVVFDDINKEFDVGNKFLKKAIEYSIKNNTAILISSNEHVNIKKHLPDYIRYDSPFADNFCVMRDLKGVSYRKEWWNGQVASTEISKMSASQKVELLAKYQGGSPAAVVVESDSIDLPSVKQAFLKDSSIAPERVRVVGAPYRKALNPRKNMVTELTEPDYFMHDAYKYDAFVMKVTDSWECKQLLNLIPKIHDKGKQIVVVTDSQKKFGQLIKEQLSSDSYREEKQRLTDRIQHLFLEDVFKVSDKEVVEEKQPKSKPPIEQPLTDVFPEKLCSDYYRKVKQLLKVCINNLSLDIERMHSSPIKVNSETHEALQVGASPLVSEKESESWAEAIRCQKSRSKESGVNYPW